MQSAGILHFASIRGVNGRNDGSGANVFNVSVHNVFFGKYFRTSGHRAHLEYVDIRITISQVENDFLLIRLHSD